LESKHCKKTEPNAEEQTQKKMSLSAFQDIDFTAEKLSSSSDQSSEPSGEKVDLKVQEKKKLDEIQAI